MRRAARAAALAAGVLLGASCGDADQATDTGVGEAPLVVATTSIWADITANVACDGLARVEPIIPAGADAHSFEPSLAGRGRVQDAVLIVANGLDLEAGLADTLASARDDGAVVLTVADEVEVEVEVDPEARTDDTTTTTTTVRTMRTPVTATTATPTSRIPTCGWIPTSSTGLSTRSAEP